MALSDMSVRHARITGNDYTLGDTDWLALNVTAQGGKIWYFRYYWAGKQKRMSLGSYPQISLREARARRDEARALVAQGINPYEHRKQQRRAVRSAAEHTFEAVFNQWVEFRRLSLKEGRQSTLSQILRTFNKDILPFLGGRSIYDIRSPRSAGFTEPDRTTQGINDSRKVSDLVQQIIPLCAGKGRGA